MSNSSSAKGRVFVLEDGRFNTDDASRFGSRVFMFERAPSPLNVDAIHEGCVQRLTELGFDPGRDYVALTGSSAQLAIFTVAVHAISGGSPIRFLVFDARNDAYVHRRLGA